MATRTLNVLLTADSKAMATGFASSIKSSMGLKAGLAAAAVGAAALGKAIYDVGEEFDNASDTIRVGTGKTGKALERLEKDFKNVVSSVPTDFESAAEAVAELNTRLDVTGKPLRERSKQFLELSRITNTDVAENIQAVTRAFGDWEVKTGQQGKQLDKFFRAAQMSDAAVSDLAAQTVQFGAPLRQIGFSLDEATALFASFEKAGVNTTTMMPGLKQAMKTFYNEDVDPKEGIKKAFKGIESGSIKASEALEIFGTRAGGDMIEAVQQGRFNLDAFQRQIVTGNDTIRKAGRETMDFAEKWKLLKNRIMVAVEPLASVVYEAVSKAMGVVLAFGEELRQWRFDSPISSAVAYGAAVASIAASAVLAGKALQGLFLLAARNPFGALAIGAGVLVGALIGLQGEEKRTVGAYRRSKQALESLGGASKRTKELRQKEKGAAGEVKAAENRLAQAREQFGARSQPALEAEADLIAKRRRHKRINDELAKSERVGGAERQAIMAILREDTAKLARGVARLVSEKEEERFQLGNLTERYKEGLVPLSRVRDKQDQLGETTKELNTGNRRLNELLLEAGRKIGPKFADKLADAAGKAANLARKGGEVNQWLKNLPAKTRMEIEVDIKVGGVNVGKGGTGDGWGVAGIKGAIRGKVEDYVQNNPGSFMQGSGALGNAPTGAGPAAVDMFTPYANKFGLSVSSGYRPGSITSSGNVSYHALNRARDYADGPVAMMAFAKFMASTFGSKLRELIYTPLGFSIKDGAQVAPYAAAEHYDHVHVALQRGGGVEVPGSGSGDKVPLRIMAEPGERFFILNRNASKAAEMLGAFNSSFPRFQGGGGGIVGKMGTILMRHGLDKEAAAGIIGNAYGESGWNPAAIEPGTHNGGLWGFTASPVSLAELKAYAESQGMPWTSVKAQTQFMLHHLSSSQRSALNSLDSVAETTEWFMANWERPASMSSLGKRTAAAQSALKALGGLGGGGSRGKAGSGGRKGRARGDGKTGGMQAPAAAAKGPTTLPKRPVAGFGSVPNILQGPGMKGIEDIFRMPGLSDWRKSELALDLAEDTPQTWDERGVMKFQLNLSKQRKRKAQKEIARINKRLGAERLTDRQRKQLISKRDAWLGQLGTWNERIGTAREGLNPESESPEAGEDPAVKAQEENTRALEEHTAALKGVQDELKRQTDFATSATATSSATAWKALADILSGTLGGSAQQAAQLAGAGGIGTTGRF